MPGADHFNPFSKRLLVTYGHPCDSVFSDFLDPFRQEEKEEEAEEESPQAGEAEKAEPGSVEAGGSVKIITQEPYREDASEG